MITHSARQGSGWSILGLSLSATRGRQHHSRQPPSRLASTSQATAQAQGTDAPRTLSILQPDDWHLHLRDGAGLHTTAPMSALHFHRAIIMPNLTPPVTTTDQALAYRQRIQAALPSGSTFQPLMTLYLTDSTTAAEVQRAHDAGITAFKLYPAGATTNSDSGVTELRKCWEALDAMAKCRMPLLIHGEVTDPAIDFFDREKVFIETRLKPLLRQLPDLKVVLEHITTKDAADFVMGAPANVAATVTPQHMLLNRNALFLGGLRPHSFCLPILKREEHRRAVLASATSGSPKFFLGTDSAPHPRNAKEASCGCAGIFSAPIALALYAEAFDSVGALDKLEGFASRHGPAFYGLPPNTLQLHLVSEECQL
ncbi:hypothetical protein WJX73_010198 [Symbiochloris irregularis]|uniref:dihydroorotase n=1 Tax=Symbiochloris irregularis TaxID=706552 RepID=A0AAW1PUG6_9CHLO